MTENKNQHKIKLKLVEWGDPGKGAVIHMRAKLGYLTEDIVNLNNVYFEENAITTSQWSSHKQLKLGLSDVVSHTDDDYCDVNGDLALTKLKIKCRMTIDDSCDVLKTWTLRNMYAKAEFTYDHLVEKARKVAKAKRIVNWEELEFVFNVDGQYGENQVSNQQDFVKYCINAPDPFCIQMSTNISSQDGRYCEYGTDGTMRIKYTMNINGYEYHKIWKLQDYNKTYDALARRAREVAFQR